MKTNQREKALLNLKKVASLAKSIVKMTEDGQYCINIIQQNLSAIGLLKSANEMLMENHLNTCFKKAMATKNSATQQKMIKEILSVTKLSNR